MCQLSSKGGVAQPLFLIGRFFMIHTCSLSMDLPDKCQSSSQLFPTQTCKKKKRQQKKLGTVTIALHACFVESTVLQVTCLRFGTIMSLAELLTKTIKTKHGCLQTCQSFPLVVLLFFPLSLKALVFLKWREQFSIFCISFFFFCLIEIGENWHMCFKGKWGQLEKGESEYKRAQKVPPSPAF